MQRGILKLQMNYSLTKVILEWSGIEAGKFLTGLKWTLLCAHLCP